MSQFDKLSRASPRLVEHSSGSIKKKSPPISPISGYKNQRPAPVVKIVQDPFYMNKRSSRVASRLSSHEPKSAELINADIPLNKKKKL